MLRGVSFSLRVNELVCENNSKFIKNEDMIRKLIKHLRSIWNWQESETRNLGEHHEFETFKR